MSLASMSSSLPRQSALRLHPMAHDPGTNPYFTSSPPPELLNAQRSASKVVRTVASIPQPASCPARSRSSTQAAKAQRLTGRGLSQLSHGERKPLTNSRGSTPRHLPSSPGSSATGERHAATRRSASKLRFGKQRVTSGSSKGKAVKVMTRRKNIITRSNSPCSSESFTSVPGLATSSADTCGSCIGGERIKGPSGGPSGHHAPHSRVTQQHPAPSRTTHEPPAMNPLEGHVPLHIKQASPRVLEPLRRASPGVQPEQVGSKELDSSRLLHLFRPSNQPHPQVQQPWSTSSLSDVLSASGGRAKGTTDQSGRPTTRWEAESSEMDENIQRMKDALQEKFNVVCGGKKSKSSQAHHSGRGGAPRSQPSTSPSLRVDHDGRDRPAANNSTTAVPGSGCDEGRWGRIVRHQSAVSGTVSLELSRSPSESSMSESPLRMRSPRRFSAPPSPSDTSSESSCASAAAHCATECECCAAVQRWPDIPAEKALKQFYVPPVTGGQGDVELVHRLEDASRRLFFASPPCGYYCCVRCGNPVAAARRKVGAKGGLSGFTRYNVNGLHIALGPLFPSDWDLLAAESSFYANVASVCSPALLHLLARCACCETLFGCITSEIPIQGRAAGSVRRLTDTVDGSSGHRPSLEANGVEATAEPLVGNEILVVVNAIALHYICNQSRELEEGVVRVSAAGVERSAVSGGDGIPTVHRLSNVERRALEGTLLHAQEPRRRKTTVRAVIGNAASAPRKQGIAALKALRAKPAPTARKGPAIAVASKARPAVVRPGGVPRKAVSGSSAAAKGRAPQTTAPCGAPRSAPTESGAANTTAPPVAPEGASPPPPSSAAVGNTGSGTPMQAVAVSPPTESAAVRVILDLMDGRRKPGGPGERVGGELQPAGLSLQRVSTPGAQAVPPARMHYDAVTWEALAGAVSHPRRPVTASAAAAESEEGDGAEDWMAVEFERELDRELRFD